MYLLIDGGNTRIKVGCHDGQAWIARQAVDNGQLDTVALPAGFRPQRVVIANVGGPRSASQIEAWLAPGAAHVEWLRGTPERAGVRCDYMYPERLGADRWAIAIGAWHALHRSCLLVSAGTATTIDVVDDDGVFRGGCIMPGLAMMKASLATGTAGLPEAGGEFQNLPRNTDDAIHSGCVNAQLGAIERMARSLPAGAPIILAGGAAPALQGHGIDFVDMPWLALDGLLAIARSEPAA
ncbi:type III pantothenate kinase [Uliginosibacterium sp. sgz301328]|uniref:type III pantothenate kinase n=1 Tax=Uliginosibacterium sp. sgz301328 TaxID=3243764 RepID=UPI00359EE76B